MLSIFPAVTVRKEQIWDSSLVLSGSEDWAFPITLLCPLVAPPYLSLCIKTLVLHKVGTNQVIDE